MTKVQRWQNRTSKYAKILFDVSIEEYKYKINEMWLLLFLKTIGLNEKEQKDYDSNERKRQRSESIMPGCAKFLEEYLFSTRPCLFMEEGVKGSTI